MPVLSSALCCFASIQQLCLASSFFSLVSCGLNIAFYLLINCTKDKDWCSSQDGRAHEEAILRVAISDLDEMQFLMNCAVLTTTVLLMVGHFKNQANLLIPWIVANGIRSVGTVVMLLLFWFMKSGFLLLGPAISFTFTVHLLLLFMDVYSILGVISRYQELTEKGKMPHQIAPASASSLFCDRDAVQQATPVLDSSGPGPDAALGLPHAGGRFAMRHLFQARLETIPESSV